MQLDRADETDTAHPVLHVESLGNTCSPPLPGGARTSPGIVGIFHKNLAQGAFEQTTKSQANHVLGVAPHTCTHPSSIDLAQRAVKQNTPAKIHSFCIDPAQRFTMFGTKGH